MTMINRPKLRSSYENADADGNRGIWMTFITCPYCRTELEKEDFGKDCPECGRPIDWTEGPTEYDMY